MPSVVAVEEQPVSWVESNYISWMSGLVDGFGVPYAGLVDGHEFEHLTSLGDTIFEAASDEDGTLQLHISNPFDV